MGSSKKFPMSLAVIIMLHYICSIATCSYHPSSRKVPLRASSRDDIVLSTISASPALLPYPPEVPPDITPLYPTPGSGSAFPPSSESSLPIIPSSNSPPDPTPRRHPELGISPTASLPESSVVALSRDLWLLSLSILVTVVWFW